MQKFNVKMLITYDMHNAVPRVWVEKNQTNTVLCTAAHQDHDSVEDVVGLDKK